MVLALVEAEGLAEADDVEGEEEEEAEDDEDEKDEEAFDLRAWWPGGEGNKGVLRGTSGFLQVRVL